MTRRVLRINLTKTYGNIEKIENIKCFSPKRLHYGGLWVQLLKPLEVTKNLYSRFGNGYCFEKLCMSLTFEMEGTSELSLLLETTKV